MDRVRRHHCFAILKTALWDRLTVDRLHALYHFVELVNVDDIEGNFIAHFESEYNVSFDHDDILDMGELRCNCRTKIIVWASDETAVTGASDGVGEIVSSMYKDSEW